MKNRKIVLISTLLASSVAATTVSAEGIFSKMFSSSKDAGAGFTTLLGHVPADTSYIFTNKNQYPQEVLEFHLNRSKEFMKIISELDKKDKEKNEEDEGKANKKGEPGAFISALLDDLGDKLSENKLEEVGISLKATSMIYGFDLSPVVRLTFADKEKLMATMKRAEKKSDYKVELTKCGKYDCFVSTDKEQALAVVFLDKHIAASYFPAADKAKFLAHLTGESTPKKVYSADKWDAFLKENNYKGFGEGFINLKKLSEKVKPMIAEGFTSKMSPEDFDNCMAVAEDHINNMPEIILGTKNLEVKKMSYEIVLKTSPEVSTVLQTIANETNIAKRINAPIFDLGVNINFTKMRDALTQYSNFLIKSGEEHKCKSINPKEIRKGMGGMMMAMNMGLTQFNSIYFSLANIDVEKMDPKKVDAYVSLGTDDPASLLGMVGMLSPKLMGFKVPADGSVVKLPEGAIPSKGQPVPDIFLNRTAKSLNIMIGNNKPDLIDFKGKEPEILSLNLDGKRYYKKLANVMKMIPKPATEDQPSEENLAKMMNGLGDLTGNMQQIFTADKRGFVIRYNIAY